MVARDGRRRVTTSAEQIRAALQNHQRPPRTTAARVVDALEHAQTSKEKPGGYRASLTFGGVDNDEALHGGR